MGEARRHMERVVKTTVLGSAFVLVGAVVGGYGMTRLAFRPVTSMIRTVRSISPSVPEPRVPVPNSRDELAELASTFNDLLGRINALLSRQRQFVADASHELKTPLTVIEGYLRLLRRWGAADPSVRDEALAAIEHHVTRMKRLTHDLLFLARLETEPEAKGPKALVNLTLLCSSGSTASTRPARVGAGAAVWDWPLRRPSSRPMAAASRWKAPSGRGRPSASASRGTAGNDPSRIFFRERSSFSHRLLRNAGGCRRIMEIPLRQGR